jgi:hypothetical protein
MSDQWKIKQVEQTLDAFFTQFGDFDDNSRVVLEVIFEEIYGGKNLPLFSEERQNRDETGLLFSDRQNDPPDQTQRS